jgi:hypothetical protein
MDFTEMEHEDMDWINVAQDDDQRRAVVNTAMDLQVS